MSRARTVRLAALRIDPEIAGLVPRPGAQDRAAIRAGLERDGQVLPLIVTPDLLVIDGHTRLELMRELGFKTAAVALRQVVGRDDLLRLAASLNVERRHLNDAQRAEIGLRLEAHERRRAKERMRAGGRVGRASHPSQVGDLAHGATPAPTPDRGPARVRDRVAAAVGLKSGKQYEKAKIALTCGTDQERDDLLAGKVSINQVHNRVTREQREAERAELVAKLDPAALGDVRHADAFDPATLQDLVGRVDLVIVDPPYGIADDTRCLKRGGEVVSASDGLPEWDAVDGPEVVRASVRLIAELLRPGGSFYVWMDRDCVQVARDEMARLGLTLRNRVYWRKTNPVPNGRSNYTSAIETCIYGAKGRVCTWNGGGSTPNVVDAPICGGSERTDHPTQKPEAVIERLIAASSLPGDLVVDFMAGSGTTGAVARRLGRRFVLVERERSYVDLILSRLAGIA